MVWMLLVGWEGKGRDIANYAWIVNSDSRTCDIYNTVFNPIQYPDDQITHRTNANLDVVWGLKFSRSNFAMCRYYKKRPTLTSSTRTHWASMGR